MFQSQKQISSCGIRYTRKFRLRTDASRKTQCLHALITQLPCVIVERAIHHGLVLDGWVWQEQTTSTFPKARVSQAPCTDVHTLNIGVLKPLYFP